MHSDLRFDAKDKTIREVLFSGEERYRIPRYQRSYSWTKDQVFDLWNDLQSGTTTFFGSFVFNYEKFQEDGYIDIIDGQQRITTITILFSVIRDFYKKLGIKERATLTHTQTISGRNFRTGEPTFRLKTSDTLEKYFREFIQDQGLDILNSAIPKRKEERNVRENYKFLWEEIEKELNNKPENSQKIEWLDDLRERIANLRVIWIRIDKDEDAYTIFETMNARGADLTVGDLLKNYLLSQLRPSENNNDSAQIIWKDIEDNIENSGGTLNISKFIRYHWISKYSFVTEKQLYKSIKEKVTEPKHFLSELEEASWFYHLMVSDKVVYSQWIEEFTLEDKQAKLMHDAMKGLKIMGITQCYSLLLCLLRNKAKINVDLSKYFRLIENYHFVYSGICKLPGNIVEKIYAKTSKRIQEIIESNPKNLSGKIQSILDTFINELSENLPNRITFLEKFADIEYRNYDLVIYIFSRLEKFLRETEELTIEFTKVNIEHILPQDPSLWGLEKVDIRDYVHLLGNLTLISKRINGTIGNQVLKDKIKELKKSELKINQDLIKLLKDLNLEWNDNTIKNRQTLLGELAFDKVWNIKGTLK